MRPNAGELLTQQPAAITCWPVAQPLAFHKRWQCGSTACSIAYHTGPRYPLTEPTYCTCPALFPLPQKYCSNPPQQSVGAIHVSLGQCANIAYGVCQAHAMDPKQSPCGHHFKGYQQCSGQQFMQFYTGIVNDGCKQAIQWIEQAAKATSGRRLKL